MLIVVVDSATPAITAALVQVTADPVDAGPSIGIRPAGGGPAGGVEVLAERVTVDGRAHGELLAPELAEVLAEGGVRPTDLAAIVAGVGPGPYTGLRVGLVTAAALADTLGIPAYGVCTLDALGAAAATAPTRSAFARPAPTGAAAGSAAPGHAAVPGGVTDPDSAPDPHGDVLVATDARRREVYWALYRHGVRLSGPFVGRPADLDPPPGAAFAVGDGALRYADQIGLPVADQPRYPSARYLAALAAARVRAGAPGEPLTPLYLRRPDAVAPGTPKAVLP